MIPIAGNINVTLPVTTLVNTSVPGSIALRPPSDNVVPSVSSSVVGNDARGNNGAMRITRAAAGASPAESPLFPSFLNDSAVDGIATSQTNFFAQLLGQGGGEDARALLVVYEKLLSLSQVRYKPSNASAPAPEPSGVFGRLLLQEKQERIEVKTHTPISTADVAEEVASTGVDAPLLPLPLPRTTRDTRSIDARTARTIELHHYDVEPKQLDPAPKANRAYVASIVRNNTPAQSQPLELA